MKTSLLGRPACILKYMQGYLHMRYLLSFHNADGFQALHRDYQIFLVLHDYFNIFVGEPAFLRHICFSFLSENHALALQIKNDFLTGKRLHGSLPGVPASGAVGR